MDKKIIFNIILLVTTYIVPLYLLYTSQGSAIKMGKIQTPALLILFLGSALLTYLNYKYKRQAIKQKWLWLVFMIIGILGLCYSGFILFLVIGLRNCCGF